jgi:hypothetical protein
MTTRAELIALARAELGDQGAAKLWPEAALRRWLAEAIRDYGERLPREATASWTSAAGQASYPEPAADADVLTTPSRDDELLVWLVCARALEWIATDEAKRMRADHPTPGSQPLAMAARYQGRYLEAMRLRTRLLRSARRLVVRP